MTRKKKTIIAAAIAIPIMLLCASLGYKAYWHFKPISTRDPKGIREYCQHNGYNTRYCVLVDFSRPSGCDRFIIYDLKTRRPLLTGTCAHGNGRGNTARKPRFSNRFSSHCSSLGRFKITSKGYSRRLGLRFVLDGMDKSNCNARARCILIHSSKFVGQMSKIMAYIPLSDASWGCFTTSPSTLRRLETVYDKCRKPMLLYAYR